MNIGLDLAIELADYVERFYKGGLREDTVFIGDVYDEKQKYFTDEEIGEPIKNSSVYNKNLYCTKNGCVYQKVNDSHYQKLKPGFKGGAKVVYFKEAKNVYRDCRIKRLVASAWIEVPDHLKKHRLLWVECLDGNEDNVASSNLEWKKPISPTKRKKV